MLYLVGAGGHAKVIQDTLKLNQIFIAGFIDSYSQKKVINSITVYENLPEDIRESVLIIAIGDNSTRKKLSAKYVNAVYSKAIHPQSIISEAVTIGDGTVIMAGVIVNVDSSIGRHVILNTSASIDHDCVIEDYVHISPNVAIAGNVSIGEGTHIGIGSCIIQGIKIGKWCTIGAGTVVIRDIPDGATVVGNPGRVIKINDIL